MKNKKVVLLSGFRKVVPAEYESWLESMALEGWNINKIHQRSSLWMIFERTEGKKYRYVYDLQAFPRKEYKTTYEQFGWELVGKMASVYIWRKEYIDTRPESFSDAASLKKRSQQVLWALVLTFVLFLASGVLLAYSYLSTNLQGANWATIQLILGECLIGAMLIYLGLTMRKIYINRHL